MALSPDLWISGASISAGRIPKQIRFMSTPRPAVASCLQLGSLIEEADLACRGGTWVAGRLERRARRGSSRSTRLVNSFNSDGLRQRRNRRAKMR